MVERGIAMLLREAGMGIGVESLGHVRTAGRSRYSPDWYQSEACEAVGVGHQVRARVMDSLMRASPRQANDPHYDIMLVDRDLRYDSGDGMNFIFGLGDYPNNIISVARLREIRDTTTRDIALSILAAHEFAHVLGLVSRDRNMGRDGLEAHHCMGERGPCVMQQVFSVDDLARRVVDIASVGGRFLCDDCREELSILARLYRNHGIPV